MERWRHGKNTWRLSGEDMRVLIVEDEARMAALIRQGLEEEAYAVDVVENGRDVLLWV